MARYSIDFSTNAQKIVRSIEELNKEIAQVARTGKSVKINLDTGSLRASFSGTFRDFDKQIDAIARKLSKLQIGGRAFQQQATALGIAQGMRERGGMQARAIQLGAQAGAFDQGSFAQLQRQIEAARIEASQLSPNTQAWVRLQQQIAGLNVDLQKAGRLADSIQMTENLKAFSPGSLNALEAKLTILRNRAREIAPDTTEWKELNKEIAKVEKSIARQTRRPMTGGQRLGAAGGAFLYGGGMGGGLGSALGGIAGGLMGGVPGAFTGAALGQMADNLGAMANGFTQAAAGIAQLQRGLALASIDASDFAEAQQAIRESSDTLVVPLDRVYKQFTQLRVNTKQYGLSVKDTQKILEGTVLAVSSVGGSLEDVDGAMRAVVQIFSKGSVQAEELRGQLGERFPGAVVKFAQANKMSFEELQDALQQGKVGIKEFVEFAKKNYDDYAQFSKQLATAPEFAGRRLEKAMNDMQIAIGSALGPAGAEFQDFLAETLKGLTNWVNENKDFIKEFVGDWTKLALDFGRILQKILSVAVKVSIAISKVFRGAIYEIRRLLGMVGVAEIKAQLDKVNAQILAGGTGGARRGAAPSNRALELKRDRLQAQFEAAGGQAALDAATPKPTFGGPGAGMSLERTGGADKTKKSGRVALDQLLDLESRRRLQMALSEKERRLAELIRDAKLQGNEAEAKSLDALSGALQITSKIAVLQDFIGQLINGREEIISKSLTEEQYNNKLQDANVELYELSNDLKREFYGLQVKENDLQKQAQRDLEARLQKQLDLNRLLEDAAIQAGAISPQAAVVRAQQRRFEDERLRAKELGATPEQLNQLAILQGSIPQAGSIQESIKALRDELDKLASTQELVKSSAASIGEAFSTAFKDAITGATSAREALAGFFRSVASNFADMAAQMIQKWIQMKLLGLAQSLLPSLGGAAGSTMGGGGYYDPMTGLGTAGPNFGLANGGIVNGHFSPIAKFANGGMVTGPTLGLVGEGRFNEAVVPLPNGKSIPVDLGGGAGNNISTNIVVNMNNNQASSQINGNGGQALGRELEGAVRNVILKESRPGGIIYSAR